MQPKVFRCLKYTLKLLSCQLVLLVNVLKIWESNDQIVHDNRWRSGIYIELLAPILAPVTILISMSYSWYLRWTSWSAGLDLQGGKMMQELHTIRNAYFSWLLPHAICLNLPFLLVYFHMWVVSCWSKC